MDSYTAALKISYENAMKDLMDLKEKADLFVSRINMLEEEQKKDMKRIAELEEENKTLDKELYKSDKMIKKLDKQVKTLIFERDMRLALIKEIKEENKKLKDKFMLKLAEVFLLPPTSPQMKRYKEWNYYEWYDEIKSQMRKEIKEGN